MEPELPPEQVNVQLQLIYIEPPHNLRAGTQMVNLPAGLSR